MSNLNIHWCDLDFLTQKVPVFDFANPTVDPDEFSKDMLSLLYRSEGYAIAANQTGNNVRVFVAKGTPGDLVCFNPEILEYGEDTEKMDEGCLSFPGLFLKINRAKSIRVKFQTPDGQTAIQTFSGLTARVFQHETEHLNGELFFGGVGRTRLQMAIKRAKRHGFDYDGRGLMKYA